MPKAPKKLLACLDSQLVERGLAADLREAKALVMSGAVHSGDTKLLSSAAFLPLGLPLRIKGRGAAVSRAGAKLKAALSAWRLDLQGLNCLDVGASTGGFTQAMLKVGAARVAAVELGTAQLAQSLLRNARVVSLERTDIRSLSLHRAGGPFDFAALDVSFLPLAEVLPALRTLLKPGGAWIALVKPQFEAKVKQVPRGGVIRDGKLQTELLDKVIAQARALGLEPRASMASPLKGIRGNQEFLLLGQKI